MHEKISIICIKWQSESPFFAEFLLRFKYTPNPEIITMGIAIINGRICLNYSPEFIEKLTIAELEGVLVHEIMHVLNKFMDRLGCRNIKIFNIAQDAVINETILNSKIGQRELVLPKGCVDIDTIKKMGYYDESISELVYDFLYEIADKITIICTGGEGDDTCQDCNGTGMNGDKTCQTCSGSGKKKVLKTTDNHKGMKKKLTEIEKQAIGEVIKHAKTRSWGNISNNLKSKCKKMIETKKISWRAQLRRYLSRHVNEPGRIQQNSWSKRNRRGLPLPGIKKLSNKVLVSVDTSGSISDCDIQKFFGQIEKIVKDFSNLIIIEWDVRVQRYLI